MLLSVTIQAGKPPDGELFTHGKGFSVAIPRYTSIWLPLMALPVSAAKK
jgi:hypothetical protein